MLKDPYVHMLLAIGLDVLLTIWHYYNDMFFLRGQCFDYEERCCVLGGDH